jgi:hypothetical protein
MNNSTGIGGLVSTGISNLIDPVILFLFTPTPSVDLLTLYMFCLGLISLIFSITSILMSNIKFLDEIRTSTESELANMRSSLSEVILRLKFNSKKEKEEDLIKEKEELDRKFEKLQLVDNIVVVFCTR